LPLYGFNILFQNLSYIKKIIIFPQFILLFLLLFRYIKKIYSSFSPLGKVNKLRGRYFFHYTISFRRKVVHLFFVTHASILTWDIFSLFSFKNLKSLLSTFNHFYTKCKGLHNSIENAILFNLPNVPLPNIYFFFNSVNYV
jgi:hypothetical protein